MTPFAHTRPDRTARSSRRWRLPLILLLLASVSLLPVIAQSTENNAVTISGELRQWHRVALTLNGPATNEQANPNPFTNVRLNVTFSHPNGTSYTVPGFYAADGNAAETGATAGNKWRVYFTPDATGTWSYVVSFRRGNNIALRDAPLAGTPITPANGATGSFNVKASNKASDDFRSKGMLRYVGEHYLQFAGSETYFLKNGADSPENFLAYEDFDGTYDTGGLIDNFLHRYQPHVQDWSPGDPQWHNGKGHGIIGALNYLSSQGGNSVYLITYNIDGGDGADTWPWTDHTERYRFDVSKLAQWEIVFSHMTARGIQIHMLLTERENDELLGGNSSLNDIRQLYYRELIARFSHHPALQWNIGEENDNSTSEQLAFAEYIRTLDPYDHPITVHTDYNTAYRDYANLTGSVYFNATSIQGDATRYNEWAVALREDSAQDGHPWAIYGDEQGPAVEEDMSNVNELVRDAAWGNLLGGGAGVEWYFGYQSDDFGDVQSEDWRVAEPLWRQTRIAIDFFQESVPFWRMEPRNDLIINGNSDDVLFASEGEIYVVRFRDWSPGFAPRIDLGSSTATYDVRWLDPRGDGNLEVSSLTGVSGPGDVAIGAPPRDANRDWVLLLRLSGQYDVNADGRVSPVDAMLVLNRVGQTDEIADVNNDGSVTEADVQLVLQNMQR